MKEKTVTITKKEYDKLKREANIDYEFLEEIRVSLKDIKEGRVIRVR